jgi:two-component system, chemotaxis family, chemotaxis protein CheY
MDKLKVLVVDDSLVAAQLAKQALESLGHKVVSIARNGKEAIEIYASCKPDLVTMDITMPGVDGIEATALLIADHPEARVIMVTSHAQQGMVANALKAGARGYILKPIKADKLAASIQQVMGPRQSAA